MTNSRLFSGLHSIGNQYTMILDTLCEIANASFYRGQLDKAIRILSAGIQLLEEEEVAPQDQTKLLHCYGRILTKRSFYTGRPMEEAFSPLARARQIAESLPDKQLLLADVLDGIGEAHFFRAHQVTAEEGDYDTALASFQQALELYGTTTVERGRCEALFHLGRSYQNAGEHEKAQVFFRQALELAEPQSDLLRKAELLAHLGILAFVKGDQETGRKQIEDALAIREEIGARIELPFSHLTLAEILQTQGDLSTALKHYQQSYALGEEMQVRNAASVALMGIGYLRLDEGQLEQALEYFERAYAIAESIGLKTGMQEASEALEEVAVLKKPT